MFFKSQRNLKASWVTYIDSDIIAAGGRYESLLEHFRGPYGPKDPDTGAVGVNIAFSKLVSNIFVESLPHKGRSSFKADELQGIKKADVIVVCMGDAEALSRFQLSICSELWQAGISTFLSVNELNSSLDESFHGWKQGNLGQLRL